MRHILHGPHASQRRLVKLPQLNRSFTSQDFRKHNPERRVLSVSDESLIIRNRASHDVRQYTAEFDPGGKDKTAAAGMSYIHLLVIPIKRGTCGLSA